jgi:CubicO group peptidase (beta-lactamase class C family)
MTSPAVAQTAAPAPIPTDAEIRHMLATRVETQRQATGIVVGIVDSTGRRSIAYGTMGTDDKRPVGGDTVFDVGSITKVFTALLLSDMVQREEVALEDPVTKWLAAKDLPVLGCGDRAVTLFDLATHTSGLPLRPTNLVSTDPDDKYAGYTTELLHQFLSSFKFDCEAVGRYEYSLAMIHETASAWSRWRTRRRRSASMTLDCTCSIGACRSISVCRSAGRKSRSIAQPSTAMSADTSFPRRTS